MTPGPAKYLNRELSWLAFDRRVLEEARDPSVPLLERLKFLAISAANLDEFFMVRVGGLCMLRERGSRHPDPAGMTPVEQLAAIRDEVRRITTEQYECYLGELEPALADAGIRRLRPADLSERQAKPLARLFEDEILAVLTPQAIRTPSDFPLLLTKTLSLCVRLEAAPSERRPRFALLPLGRGGSRFVTVASERGYEYVLLEDLVTMYVDRFFPGEHVVECIPFRITRNADLAVHDDRASDLLAEMQDVLDARKVSECVRLEIGGTATKTLLGFLRQSLKVPEEEVEMLPGPLDLGSLHRLGDVPGFDHLREAPWPPQPSPDFEPRSSPFEVLSRKDVLLVHPYESFEPVARLIEEAADDPDVLAIKQILYRTSPTSPIVAALRRAAERGKHVTVVIELRARFDEARNIEWARDLERAAVQVFYGVAGLKTHAKVCIVVRRQPQGIVRYVHFGTGNYNELTARLYSDVSLLTSNPELAADASTFFNAITGYSQPQRYRWIEAAPTGLRDRLLEMIEAEARRSRQGQTARIMAKLNSLADSQITDALYAASDAGVRIQLNVRGICCLRPGVPGLSDHISVVSIVDRFLEHSRLLYFHHGGDERIFLTSADWMTRNLDRRVELLVPIEDSRARARLVGLFECYFRDTVKARRLLPDGRYERIAAASEPVRAQEAIYRQAVEAARGAERSSRTAFIPLRAAMKEEG